jgi:hypothetical protein
MAANREESTKAGRFMQITFSADHKHAAAAEHAEAAPC